MDMEEKHCSDCGNYGSLANQGYWWCEAGHTGNMNPETCGDYDKIKCETSTSYAYCDVNDEKDFHN